MRFITKTSKQANSEKKASSDNSCPECNHPTLGIAIVREGWFKTEMMNEFKCRKCGCEWNNGWLRIW